MSNVWYVNEFSGTPYHGMSYRPYFLTGALNQLGHQASVFAGAFHHCLRYPFDLAGDEYRFKQYENTLYCWLNTRPYIGNGLNRLLNNLDYSRLLKKNANHFKDRCGNPDVIIASSPALFHLKTCRQLADRFSAKLILEIRDIWPLSLIEVANVSTYHPLVLWMRHLEKQVYRFADHIVCLLPDSYPYFEKFGIMKNQFSWIPNGISHQYQLSLQRENTDPLPECVTLANKMSTAGKFVIGYTGAHGPPNDLDHVIDAIARLKEQGRKDFFIIFVGDGISKNTLIKKAQHKIPGQFHFFDSIPKNSLPLFFEEIDACFIALRDEPIYEYVISCNKIFEYLYSKKPTIIAANIKTNYVALANAGVCVAPADPKALAEGMISLAQQSNTERVKMGENGYQYVIKHHDFSCLAKQFEAIF